MRIPRENGKRLILINSHSPPPLTHNCLIICTKCMKQASGACFYRRFGFGRFTTVEEIDYAAEKTIRHVKRLREMSPLWEMVQVCILA